MACTRKGICLELNAAAEAWLGRPRSELAGHAVWELFPAPFQNLLEQAFRRVAQGESPERLELHETAPLRWVDIQFQLAGEVVWVISTDKTRLKKGQERATALERLTAALASARSQAEVAEAVLSRGLSSFGEATSGLIYLRDSSRQYLELLHSQGYVPEAVRKISRLPLSAPLPSCEVLRTGEPSLLGSHHEIFTAFPALERYRHLTQMQAFAILPLATEGEAFGTLVLGFTKPQSFQEEDRTFLMSMAHQCALALDRARLHDSERQAQHRLAEEFETAQRIHARQLARALAAEQALKESESRFRNMADNAPVMLWVTGPTGFCSYLNQQWYNFTRQTEETGLGFGWLDAIHPEDTEATLGTFLRANARQESFRLETRLRRADGEYRWAIASASPRYGPAGEFLGFIGSVIDITERKQMEEARARMLRDAQFLAEASATLASSLDYETTLVSLARLAVPALADWCLVDLRQADGSFKRVEVAHAFPEDAELARQVRGSSLVPEGNPRHPPTEALLEGRPVLVPELTPERLRRSAHSEEHARLMLAAGLRSVIAVPLVAHAKTLGVLSFSSSRSGRHYTAADLSLAEELARRAALSVENALLYREARQAVQLRDEFLSIASHELKTPLTPLSLKLQAMARETEKQTGSTYVQRMREGLELGRRQVRRLSLLVDDLLDVSRIVAGRFRLDWEDVDFAAVVREVVGRYEAQAAQAGARLELEAPDAVPGRWDATRLEQIVTNLVENAIKYGAGKPITVRLVAEAGQATLTVRDRGIGIAPENQARIFERFERAVSDRHYGGLGLGLYITRTIVQAMGGQIGVQSQPGHGATFTVRLPTAPREKKENSPATSSRGPGS